MIKLISESQYVKPPVRTAPFDSWIYNIGCWMKGWHAMGRSPGKRGTRAHKVGKGLVGQINS